MEDLCLKEPIEKEKVQKVLSALFPSLVVFHYDFNFEKPRKLDLNNPLHIFFHTVQHYDRGEFKYEKQD